MRLQDLARRGAETQSLIGGGCDPSLALFVRTVAAAVPSGSQHREDALGAGHDHLDRDRGEDHAHQPGHDRAQGL